MLFSLFIFVIFICLIRADSHLMFLFVYLFLVSFRFFFFFVIFACKVCETPNVYCYLDQLRSIFNIRIRIACCIHSAIEHANRCIQIDHMSLIQIGYEAVQSSFFPAKNQKFYTIFTSIYPCKCHNLFRLQRLFVNFNFKTIELFLCFDSVK